MARINDPNNPDIRSQGTIGGYALKRIEEIAQAGMFFYELEHAASGARHIHLSNDDRENTFGVVFKTVPRDSTGVAHILEHTVLCGSETCKYRVVLQMARCPRISWTWATCSPASSRSEAHVCRN